MNPFATLPQNVPLFWLSYVMPIGAVIAYAGLITDGTGDAFDPFEPYPEDGAVNPLLWGWRLCDGTEYDPEYYTSLHAVLGKPEPATLPDYQGFFLRGAGPCPPQVPPASAPSGREAVGAEELEVGGVLDQTLISHKHMYKHDQTEPLLPIGGPSPDETDGPIDLAAGTVSQSETRPVCVGVNYLIRVTYQVPWAGFPRHWR